MLSNVDLNNPCNGWFSDTGELVVHVRMCVCGGGTGRTVCACVCVCVEEEGGSYVEGEVRGRCMRERWEREAGPQAIDPGVGR